MSAKVVITGAGGFVGAALTQAFIAAGHRVWALDRQFETGMDHPQVTRVEGPLEDSLAGTPEAADLMIHGAAITASPQAMGIPAAQHLARNTSSLLRALTAARHLGTGRFVFLSSTGVFAAQDGAGTLDETVPATGTGPYAAAKRAGELLTQAAAETGFSTLSVRLGYLFGPGERARPTRPGVSLVTRMLAEAQSSGTISSGHVGARREWTFLPDLAQAVTGLLDDWPDQPMLHAGSPPIHCDQDIAEALRALIPGARAELSGAPVLLKPPMVSACPSVFARMQHTALPDALAACLLQRGVA